MLADSLTTVVLLAIIVEVVTNALKTAIPSIKNVDKKNGSRIAAAVVGIALCITTKVGILHNLNIEMSIDILDYIITGIVISRGANAVHDITNAFNKNKLA